MFSFAIDWMHCVSLGCVKYVMTLLMQDKGRSYFVGAASTMHILSVRLLAIKTPDIVGRYPRALTEFSHWKATELIKLVVALVPASNAFHPTIFVSITLVTSSKSSRNFDIRFYRSK